MNIEGYFSQFGTVLTFVGFGLSATAVLCFTFYKATKRRWFVSGLVVAALIVGVGAFAIPVIQGLAESEANQKFEHVLSNDYSATSDKNFMELLRNTGEGAQAFANFTINGEATRVMVTRDGNQMEFAKITGALSKLRGH
ncbi:hypothetical protein IV500_04210 [Paeniglutamicibacter antarcticus]|uniref:Uncharacterized protein n=1 Tax=Arthrobacter terrae TaxID=2935737 RepID=A0A931CPH9_9MICC|nr:hypothetical protein [Arthrobacter terrae]MBG0738624.1 hypothetical protein [Arthrobacter terrae]